MVSQTIPNKPIIVALTTFVHPIGAAPVAAPNTAPHSVTLGSAFGGATAYDQVRLYLPVMSHSISFADTPNPITSSLNYPEGILPHHEYTYETTTTAATKSTNNVGTNNFRNALMPQGKWQLAIAMRGTLQRVTVFDSTSNPNGLLPRDATDARGYPILGNPMYLISGTYNPASLTSGIYGMTGDQLRNELYFLLAAQTFFGGSSSNPLYYMFPYWRSRPFLTLSGTATIANASASVVGSGTSFTTQLTAGQNVVFGTDYTPYTIQSIADNTHLTLTQTYQGPTPGGSVTMSTSALYTFTGTLPFDHMQPDPHYFRGFVASASVNDESGKREAYDFTLTFNIANVKPVS